MATMNTVVIPPSLPFVDLAADPLTSGVVGAGAGASITGAEKQKPRKGIRISEAADTYPNQAIVFDTSTCTYEYRLALHHQKCYRHFSLEIRSNAELWFGCKVHDHSRIPML
jgi:hypothetical protein